MKENEVKGRTVAIDIVKANIFAVVLDHPSEAGLYIMD